MQVNVVLWFTYLAGGSVGLQEEVVVYTFHVCLVSKAFMCMFNFLLKSCCIDEVNISDHPFFRLV